jgi:hypothetical protein
MIMGHVSHNKSGRLHSEFVRILFFQAHRETDRFFAASGVQFAQTHPGDQFTFHRAAFLTQLQNKVFQYHDQPSV